jgi:hypothetical protein
VNLDDFVASMEAKRSRRTGPPPKAPRCSRCDDGGLVLLDAHADDPRMADGFRKVQKACRCECAEGGRYPAFPLAPPEDPYHLRLLPTRKDLDG